jgi:hypothetical protein
MQKISTMRRSGSRIFKGQPQALWFRDARPAGSDHIRISLRTAELLLACFPSDCPNRHTRGYRKGVCYLGPSIDPTTTYCRAYRREVEAEYLLGTKLES